MTDDPIKRVVDTIEAPTEPGGFDGDIWFGHPEHRTLGTHRWSGGQWHCLATVEDTLLVLLAQARCRAEKAEAALALRVEVKPLEWEGDGHWSHGPDEGWMEEANTPFGWGYSIEFDNSGKGSFVACSTFGETLAGFDTPVEAKAAAQADYDARILSAIEPADPATIRAEALREALQEIERLYYTEGKDASWRAAHMRAIATAALIDKEQDQ